MDCPDHFDDQSADRNEGPDHPRFAEVAKPRLPPSGSLPSLPLVSNSTSGHGGSPLHLPPGRSGGFLAVKRMENGSLT